MTENLDQLVNALGHESWYLTVPADGRPIAKTAEVARRYLRAISPSILNFADDLETLPIEIIAEAIRDCEMRRHSWIETAAVVFVGLEPGWKTDSHVVSDLAVAETFKRKVIFVRLDDAGTASFYDHEMMPLAVNQLEAA